MEERATLKPVQAIDLRNVHDICSSLCRYLIGPVDGGMSTAMIHCESWALRKDGDAPSKGNGQHDK